jgi:hypothetical protein
MKDHVDSIFDRLGMVLRIGEGNSPQTRVVFGVLRYDSRPQIRVRNNTIAPKQQITALPGRIERHEH